MFKPHHKSYYYYFEVKRKKRTTNICRYIIARQKIANSDLSFREYHYFFKQIKQFLGNGLGVSKVGDYLKHINQSHTTLMDQVRADLRDSLPEEQKVHPWKARYKLSL